MADSELIQSVLNTTASMQILSDELDRISMHSSLHSDSTPIQRKKNDIPQTTPKLSRSSSFHSNECDSPCISNKSTPTLQRESPPSSLETPQLEEKNLHQRPLTPQVANIYPNDTDIEYTQNSPRRPRAQFPKKGTLFYQESLIPQPKPFIGAAHGHANSSHHHLPSQYRDISKSSSPISQPKRNPSILHRLKRTQGSFLEKGRHFPVKRSFSDRETYHINKGWIDYEEDLDFISQPNQPRPVGRMIDKKEGRLHVVQLYKPPGGRYGIYIVQKGIGSGVYVSRFASSTAEKLYTGMISPGDQIIRVNGINIKDQSVDDVYDLMTVSDSVIFTVIPVSSQSDW